MEVKSFTYERNWTGILPAEIAAFSMQAMDKHITRMLNYGWEIVAEVPHSGDSRGFRLLAKRDTITVSLRRAS